jgi:hypothetical protein
MGPPRGNQPGVRIRSFSGGLQDWGMPARARKKGERRRVRGLVECGERQREMLVHALYVFWMGLVVGWVESGRLRSCLDWRSASCNF